MRRVFSLIVFMMLMMPVAAVYGQAPPHLIDCHVHYNGDPAFLEKLVAKLNEVDGMAFLLTKPADLGSAEAAIKKYPNRLVGFGDISPDNPRALEILDSIHAAGFRGVGEITSTLKNYDDHSYWPFYARAEKYRMIMLFHTGIVNRTEPMVASDISVDRLRPTLLDGVARRFPKLTIIGAHLGNPDYAWAGEIARWNPNVYWDLSGSSLQKKENDYTFFKSIFWWSGAGGPHTPKSGTSAFEKLVFASDVFNGELEEFDRELARYHKMLDACDVPPEAQANIFAGTLWKILNTKP
jgi:uncharacterized protein